MGLLQRIRAVRPSARGLPVSNSYDQGARGTLGKAPKPFRATRSFEQIGCGRYVRGRAYAQDRALDFLHMIRRLSAHFDSDDGTAADLNLAAASPWFVGDKALHAPDSVYGTHEQPVLDGCAGSCRNKSFVGLRRELQKKSLRIHDIFGAFPCPSEPASNGTQRHNFVNRNDYRSGDTDRHNHNGHNSSFSYHHDIISYDVNP